MYVELARVQVYCRECTVHKDNCDRVTKQNGQTRKHRIANFKHDQGKKSEFYKFYKVKKSSQ